MGCPPLRVVSPDGVPPSSTPDHEGFAHVSLPSPVRVAKHSQVGIYLTSTGSLKRSLFSRRAGGQVNTDSGPLKARAAGWTSSDAASLLA